MTEIAAKLLSNVTFDPFTKRAFTLAAGSVGKIIDRDLDTILPGKEIPYPFAWGTALPAGKYNANVVLSGCGPQSTRTAELELANPHRYRVRTLPAAGALLREEDTAEQMTLL